MTTDQLLAGLGLVLVLAIACQLVAARTRVPAIVLLLPVGFVAGAATDVVHPDVLFGDTFQPLVSLGVGLILFEAGLRLRVYELGSGVRRVVGRLILIGTPVTTAGVMVAVKVIFGLGWGVSLVIGAILVVSGPTVVLPLLAFVRPTDRVRSVLKWEGTLIDPVGALLGVVAFHAVLSAGAGGDEAFRLGGMLLGLITGSLVGAAGAALLWLMLGGFQRAAPRQAVSAALMVVAGALVAADLLQDDAGFVATTVMGVILANQRRVDVSGILEFQGTVVTLLIGVLFVLISASVEPSQVLALLPEGLILVAVLVLVIRPAVVALGTWGSELDGAERAFAAWLAPRGIVAAATASAFGLQLTQAGVAGAGRILPVVFIVIFGTVLLYGLSAAPVARLLGLAGAGGSVVLVVGGHGWAREIAQALERAGLGVRLWTGRTAEQVAAREAGLAADNARLGGDLARREAELEEVDDVLLVTESDDFNALAAGVLRQELGNDHVYRLPAASDLLDALPAHAEGGILFSEDLTFPELTRRFEGGARLVELTADDVPNDPSAQDDGMRPLFVVTGTGELRVVTMGAQPPASPGEKTIFLAGGPTRTDGPTPSVADALNLDH